MGPVADPSDLDRSILFYTESFDLKRKWLEDAEANLAMALQAYSRTAPSYSFLEERRRWCIRIPAAHVCG